MTTLIVGSTSNLAYAVKSYCVENEIEFTSIDTQMVKSWSRIRDLRAIRQELYNLVSSNEIDKIIYSCGLTNQNTDDEILDYVNHLLPLEIASFFSKSEIRVFFPGAMMENFPVYCKESSYLRSKIAFSRSLEEVDGNWLNLRFNQWYGTQELRKNLFIGGAISAIANRTRFDMTSGKQLREFHHIEDDVKTFFSLAVGVMQKHIDVTSGETLRIGEVAVSLFRHFDSLDLLNIGSLQDSPFDNYAHYSIPNSLLSKIGFRDTLSGILEYAKNWI